MGSIGIQKSDNQNGASNDLFEKNAFTMDQLNIQDG